MIETEERYKYEPYLSLMGSCFAVQMQISVAFSAQITTTVAQNDGWSLTVVVVIT